MDKLEYYEVNVAREVKLDYTLFIFPYKVK